MLTGLNHLTLAVTDLDRSLAFYRDVLQLRVEATWDAGAYLSLPGLWRVVLLPRPGRSQARSPRRRSGLATGRVSAKALRGHGFFQRVVNIHKLLG